VGSRSVSRAPAQGTALTLDHALATSQTDADPICAAIAMQLQQMGVFSDDADALVLAQKVHKEVSGVCVCLCVCVCVRVDVYVCVYVWLCVC